MINIMMSIVSLLLIMLVGIYGSKKKIITAEINRGLTDILLRIALPFMIISSFSLPYEGAVKDNVVRTFYYSFASYIIVIIVSYLLTIPIQKEKRVILHFANVFTNTGYIGFPILDAIYGTEAVMYGSIFNMFFVILLWTYGIVVFKGSIGRKELMREITRAFLNPSVVAVYFGVIIIIFGLRLPDALLFSIRSIGNMTIPLSMIIIGVIFSDINIKGHLLDWTIYYGIITKIILIPAALYSISLLIGDRSIVVNSVIILASMPPAVMTSIFAEGFNLKKEYATVIVVVTTLLSGFTIPLLLKIII